MGRPLYSRTFITTPAVRDPDLPSCEKWSYLNAFDPDSDEFFDNENAVYEDFIGPVAPANMEGDGMDDEEEDDDDDDDETDMLVVRMGNISPITSESSLSDNESPLADGAEDLVVDAFHGVRQMDEEESEPAVRVRLATRAVSAEGWVSQMTEMGPVRPQFATRGAHRVGSQSSYTQRAESLPVPAPSAPIPVPAVSRRSHVVDERPSTPPRQTPVSHFSMSPPPATTPRLYTWTRNPSVTSPSLGSPFSNPHARTSYTHLSPALIRIRDVTV